MAGRVGLQVGRMHDGDRQRIGRGFDVLAGADQQIADEQGMPGAGGQDGHAILVARIGTGQQVLAEQFALPQCGHGVAEQHLEMLGAHGPAIVPPHGVLGQGIAHDVFVLGGTAGEGTGAHRNGAIGGQFGFTARQRPGHQHRSDVVDRQRAGIGCNGLANGLMVERAHILGSLPTRPEGTDLLIGKLALTG